MRTLLPPLVEPQRSRIECLLQLAEANDLGFGSSERLMYLDPLAVALFIDMSESRRTGALRFGTPPPSYMVNAILELLLLIPEVLPTRRSSSGQDRSISGSWNHFDDGCVC